MAKVAANSMYDAQPPMAVPVATPIGQPAGNGMQMFQHSAISVEQTMRGCFQECLGCEVRACCVCHHTTRVAARVLRCKRARRSRNKPIHDCEICGFGFFWNFSP
jgi:hypothetical protein